MKQAEEDGAGRMKDAAGERWRMVDNDGVGGHVSNA